MKKRMWIKYDLSGNKKDDVIECIVKDNIIKIDDDILNNSKKFIETTINIGEGIAKKIN